MALPGVATHMFLYYYVSEYRARGESHIPDFSRAEHVHVPTPVHFLPPAACVFSLPGPFLRRFFVSFLAQRTAPTFSPPTSPRPA